jgi:Asp-tRNA(Asn)/Glu-tRNA(Gln) amidotransferase A subunit family amidase
MSDTDFCYLSAAEAIAMFRQRSLSPVELMQAIADRSASLEPHIHAFTEAWFDDAMDAAWAAERRYRDGNARPLEGIPLAVKDELRLAGRRRTQASLIYRDRVDDESDVIIQRLLDAGAIAHAKTTTPEFCLLGSCHSRLWGITRNPWNLDVTPGGSSGGSGAALAAGTTILATGTDIGGSIRIPSALCGTVGYKPPYGRNPEVPVFNLDFYSHSGPMTRSVADAALMQNLISGIHNRDIASMRERVRLDTSPPDDLAGWKIAYSLDLGFMEVDESIRKNTLAALDILRGLGAEVEAVEIDWDESIIEAAHSHWAHFWAGSMESVLDEHRDELCDYTVWFIENARRSTLRDFQASLESAVRMYDRFGPLMDEYDLFVCPTLMTSAVPNDSTWPENEVEINGRIVRCSEEHWSATYPFNTLSRCPVLSLPSGLAANGVPTAVQFVARSYDDQRVFSAALAYEQAFERPTWRLDSRITDGEP